MPEDLQEILLVSVCATYLPQFLLKHQSFSFLFLTGGPLLHDLIYENYGGCRSTQCLPTVL
jgi:hypothetical protein